MKRKWLGLAGSVLLSLSVLSACGDEDNSSSTGSGDSEGDRTLTIAMGTDMVTFDIHNHVNTSTEAIHVNMFNYLFKRDNETGEILPDLAESYKKIDDTTWEVKLKEGVTFHNGEALDAEDVKFTLERVALDSTLLDHINYNSIKEVEVIDDLTFNIITNEPILLY